METSFNPIDSILKGEDIWPVSNTLLQKMQSYLRRSPTLNYQPFIISMGLQYTMNHKHHVQPNLSFFPAEIKKT